MMNKTVLLITVSCVSLYTGALSYADIHSYHTPPRLSGTADTKSHNLYTPHLVAAHLSSLEDFASLTLPENSAPSILSLPKNLGNYLFYPLPKDLGRGWGGFHNTPLIQLTSVCFVTDTGDCSGNEFSNADSEDGHGAPGGPGDDFDLDNEERCRQEGYNQTSCPKGQEPSNTCPYDSNYFEKCVPSCPSDYVTCEPPYYGVGEACGDKYASCEKDTERACQELNPGYVDNCGSGQKLSDDRCSYDNSYGICCDTCSGYPYTADSIPNGYVQDGEACVDCDGNQKVKVKPNPCDGFMDCGSVGPETGANTCLSGTATLYDNCKPCPNLGIYDSCPSPYTCSFEDCSNKYYPTGCKSGYVWNANNKTCTCDTSVYKYACTGTAQKGSGQACDGKYKSCTCSNGKTWNGKECVCDSSYKYTCNGTNESPSGTSCGGKYKSCYCSGAYDWDGSSCSCSSSYKYTCTGTGYAGGYGTSCDGKYEGCNCSNGKSWNGKECVCASSYKYTCNGTGYAGGSGDECSGKYKSCTCASGYEWKNGNCQKEITQAEWGKCNGYANKCYIGSILYSDGTCSYSAVSTGKTPIAIVVYKGGSCAQAMALESIGNYKWGASTDIPEINNLHKDYTAATDLKSCENTTAITSTGTSSTFPAAWATKNYKTAGTNAGDWCLPAAGIMKSIKNNMSIINNGFNLAGGTQIETNSKYLTSSENNFGSTWRSDFTYDYGLYDYAIAKNYATEVRPVIEF